MQYDKNFKCLVCKKSSVREILGDIIKEFRDKTKDLYPDFEDRVVAEGVCNGFSMTTIISKNNLFEFRRDILYSLISESDGCYLIFNYANCAITEKNLNGQILGNKTFLIRLVALNDFIWLKLQKLSIKEPPQLYIPCAETRNKC